MKRCSRCKLWKNDKDFATKKGKLLQPYCRPCQKKYRSEHYRRNRPKYIGMIAERKAEIARWWQEIKATLRCSRCPESDPVCLDFHHRERAKKDRSVSKMVQDGRSKECILAEMKKCDVLCANCHRKEHRDDRGLNNAH